LTATTSRKEAIRVDDRGGVGQQRFGDVMIDDDHLEPSLGSFRQRQMRIRTAIDRDHHPHPFVAKG
jgi:hypothetical protein